jgi:hypothetical protein
MPRPERPIDPGQGPVQRFAAELRRLRQQAGGRSYRDMAADAHYSRATLSSAASGHRLPTWEVTKAYVLSCGGDPDQWRESWLEAQGAASARSSDRPTPLGEPNQQVGGRPAAGRWWRRPVVRVVGATTAMIVIAATTVMMAGDHYDTPLSSQQSNIASNTLTARFEGPENPVIDDGDPKLTRCAYDPRVATIDSVEVNTPDRHLLGIAELRYSPVCRVAWGRFTPSDRMAFIRQADVTITARRPATDTVGESYTTAFDGQAVFGNILSVQNGCVEIAIVVTAVTGDGLATTRCAP